MTPSTDRTTILYRGSLKSCNYHCSYCPFSKHRMWERELKTDREQWIRFWNRLLQTAPGSSIRGLQVVPYGEALIHSWYWEGFARLSASDAIDAVGAQTNLSFPVEKMLALFHQAGGKTEKLRLWATFHPEMVSAGSFFEQCMKLTEGRIRFCVGAVGVPEQLPVLRQLRSMLPNEIYLWINQMEGCRRPYTQEEIRAFCEIDPYFMRELLPVPCDAGLCRQRLLVEGSGSIRTCVISPPQKENWYERTSLPVIPEPVCSRPRCSCYLAYGGRRDVMNEILFGPDPLFRIPRRPQAVFLDIDGTLIPEGESRVPERTRYELEALKQDGNTMLFFATSLPYAEAIRRCREICHLFQGGIFAAGAHLVWPGRERFYFIPAECALLLRDRQKSLSFRLLSHRHGGNLYKLTLLHPARRPWTQGESNAVVSLLPLHLQNQIRILREHHCLQIVSVHATKAHGMEEICRHLEIPLGKTAAAGDSEEDEEMKKLSQLRHGIVTNCL